MEQLDSEINILKEKTVINNENIIQLHDLIETQNNIYMMMEYCNGGDLNKLLEQRGRFTEGEARFVMSSIIEGYSAIHKLNVVHRDLKLENILLHFKNYYIEDVFRNPSKFEQFKVGTNLTDNVNIIIGDLGFAT